MCIGKRGQGKEQLINMVMLAPLIAGSGHFQKIIQHIKHSTTRSSWNVHALKIPEDLSLDPENYDGSIKKRLVMINIDQLLLVDY